MALCLWQIHSCVPLDPQLCFCSFAKCRLFLTSLHFLLSSMLVSICAINTIWKGNWLNCIQLTLATAWPGRGTARGLPRRKSRVRAPKLRHSFLSSYLQLSLDLSLPGQITPDQVPLNKKNLLSGLLKKECSSDRTQSSLDLTLVSKHFPIASWYSSLEVRIVSKFISTSCPKRTGTPFRRMATVCTYFWWFTGSWDPLTEQFWKSWNYFSENG
jgi:hypothetical protein